MQTNQEKQMYEIIRTAIMNIKMLAKNDLRNEWRFMKMAERYKAGRALVHMETVAEDPAQYFSRHKTDLAWRNRAIDFIRENSLNDDKLDQAYLIVPGPADLVAYQAEAAMVYNNALNRSYYLLCQEIVNWEYNRTSKQPSHQARVAGNAENIQNMAIQIDRLVVVSRNTLTAYARKLFKSKGKLR